MNKHELSAWWRLVLSALFGLYLCNVLFFDTESISTEGWQAVRGNLNILLVVILLLDAWLRRRQGIAADERDRAISGIAARDALVALGIVVLVTPMVLKGGEPASKDIVAREYDWMVFYAMACIAFAIWVEAAVTVFHHWRDRR